MRAMIALPYLTADQHRNVDQLATGQYGFSIDQMMELAGLAVAQVVKLELGSSVLDRIITIVCGKGHNGGDGFVAARHLANWGAQVAVLPSEPTADYRGLPERQLKILQKFPIKILNKNYVSVMDIFKSSNLVVDALLGVGAKGMPADPLASLIADVNSSLRPVVAVDIPSGMDATTGEPYHPCVRAVSTVTFGLPKSGFLNPKAKPYLGKLILADIGIPSKLYEEFGYRLGPLFTQFNLISLEPHIP